MIKKLEMSYHFPSDLFMTSTRKFSRNFLRDFLHSLFQYLSQNQYWFIGQIAWKQLIIIPMMPETDNLPPSRGEQMKNFREIFNFDIVFPQWSDGEIPKANRSAIDSSWMARVWHSLRNIIRTSLRSGIDDVVLKSRGTMTRPLWLNLQAGFRSL